MLVMKFGGTSVGSGERMLEVARIVLEQVGQEPVVVVSAMAGVTDALLALAEACSCGDAAGCDAQYVALHTRHMEAASVIDTLGDWEELHGRLADLRCMVEEALRRREDGAAGRDAMVAWGELLSIALVAGALRRLGWRAQSCKRPMIVTDGQFGEASPVMSATRKRVALELAQAGDAVLVVPGFIGQTVDGRVTTLGRGGSDYVATLLAAALHARACWIYTDVDGIFTADPRIVPEARILPVISAATAGRLCYSGAKVLHPRSVAPAARYGIELRVRNTFRPEHAGTVIRAVVDGRRGLAVAVAGRGKLCAISITGPGLAEVANLFGRMCLAVTRAGAEIVQASHPIPGHDPQLIIDGAWTEAAVAGLMEEFAEERCEGQVSEFVREGGLALCTLVGDELMVATLAQAQQALSSRQIRPLSLSACAEALSFVLPEEALKQAMRCLHRVMIEARFGETARRRRRRYGANACSEQLPRLMASQ